MEKSGKIIVINEIHGDWPIGHNIKAKSGVHDAF